MNNATQFVVLTENGGSESNIYHDVTGVLYSFPKSSLKLISQGVKYIYHSPALKKGETRQLGRLSDLSHYFGCGEIGTVTPTPEGNYTAQIINYKPFAHPVFLYEAGVTYFEGEGTVFQKGVRRISETVYNKIIQASMTPFLSTSTRPNKGIRTRTSLNVLLHSRGIPTQNGNCQVVTDSDGYWLMDQTSKVYYPLKRVSPFPKKDVGELRVLKSKHNDRYILLHDNEEVGTIEPTNGGILFTDSATKAIIKHNL